MKKLFIHIISMMFTLVCLNVFGQTKLYPFEVKVSGKGSRAAILIPGFACSGEVWDATRRLLEKDFTCHTLTMAGFAGIPPQTDPSFLNWEKAIADYITENKIIKPLIIGHSMGGGLAMTLAADYPHLVSAIIVVDALPCLAALTNPSFTTKINNDCGPIISKYTSIPDEQFYLIQKQSIPQLLADTTKQALVVSWSVKSDRATFARMFCDFSNTDLREKITGITCPSLILLESYFVNFKPAIIDQYKNMQTADLRYASKGLHFIMYDDQAWYDEQIKGFIKKR